MFDDAAARATKQFIEIPPYDLQSLIEPHAGCSFYLFASTAEGLKKATDKQFTQNGMIWQEILEGKLKRTDQVIKLHFFYLFEWFPRCPGLYYTGYGRDARNEAGKHILSTENGMVIYNTTGKQNMLDGGIGSIRLRPIKIEDENYYLMSASSNVFCDSGFPVAVPEILYNKYIDQISTNGAAFVDLYGKLIAVPDEVNGIFSGYRGVPKLLLRVDDIKDCHDRPCQFEPLTVNIAVSFESGFEDKKRIYVSYASFDPSGRQSFQESKEWLEEDYVRGMFKGRIITDFDQTMEHFENAPFSLNKVMNFELKSSSFQNIDPNYSAFNYSIQQQDKLSVYFQSINIEKMEKKQTIKMRDGQAFIIGDGSTTGDIHQTQTSVEKEIDLEKLAEEISMLRAEAKNQSVTPEHDQEVGNLAAAEIAARTGDKSKALALLKKAGTWTLDIATKIGVGLAISAIKDVLPKL